MSSERNFKLLKVYCVRDAAEHESKEPIPSSNHTSGRVCFNVLNVTNGTINKNKEMFCFDCQFV